MKYVLIGFLKVYRLVISPLYGNVCRYYPSCSAYALGSVQRHGAIKGSWLAAKRLSRCHPWAAGGYDPVPGTPEAEQWEAEQWEAELREAEQERKARAEGPSDQPEAPASEETHAPHAGRGHEV